MQKFTFAEGPKRFRSTKTRMLSLLNKFNSQDKLTVAEFCMKHDISRTNFYAWKKRHGTKAIDDINQKGFVSVQVALPPASLPTFSEQPLLFAEVNGIRLYHFVSADYLKSLLP